MKKLLLCTIFLFQLTFIFGQICVDSKTLYSNVGLNISYCTESLGNEGNCKKYKVTISINNNNSNYISIAGSSISILSDQTFFTAVGKCGLRSSHADSEGDVRLVFPGQGLGFVTELKPNYNVSNSYIIYTNNTLPRLSYYIVPVVEKNKSSNSTSSSTQSGFSAWKKINSADCDLGIEYRIKKEERYQLNYQLWFYYEVRNTSNKNISFTFNLTKNGNVEFSQPHVLSPGGVDEFMHKMSGDYIDGVSVTKVLNTKTNKDICDDSKNNNSLSTNNSVSSNFQSILQEHNDLCEELSKVVTTSNPSSIFVNLCQNLSKLTWEETNANKQTLIAQNTQLRNEIKRLSGNIQQQDASQQQEQERQKQESDRLVQKTSKFTELINEGDERYNDGKYKDAISKYTQAKNLYTGNILPQEEAYAKDAIPLANARIAKAEKALKDAARKERVDKAYEADKKEDIAFATAAAGAIGIMAFLKDQFSYRQTFLKLQVGLGMEGLPLITNTNILGKSQTDLSIHPDFFFGLKLGLMNKLPVNIHISPYFQYGFNALMKGVKGVHMNTGVTGTLLASWKNTGIFKLFFESSYYYRAGSYTYDVDAVNGSNSATDEVRIGEYNYSAYNLGAGFVIDIIKSKRKGNMQTYIKPGIYFEKALFYPKGIPYTLVSKLEVNIVSQILLQVEYCNFYHIGGSAVYPNNFESKNRPYFGIRIIRNGNLIPVVPKKYR